jgi:hypothetical protein
MPRYARAIFLLGALCVVPVVSAQDATGLDLGGGLVANGEAERYLRVLQLLGVVPQHPVAIRPWNRQEMKRLSPTGDHPWAARFSTPVHSTSGSGLQILRASARVTWNTGVPGNDGAVWFGRGLTLDGSAGVRYTSGPLDLQLAPLAFVAQNQAFALAPNGYSGAAALGDPRFPGNIDLPQRFGTSAYARVDLGNTRISIDTRAVAVGFSSAPLAWGPARDEPLTLGPNGGGFPHLYAGSGEPWPIGIGTLHVKLIAGRLGQSAWSPVTSGDQSRFLSGVVATVVPRGVPGLELGFVRTAMLMWHDATWRSVFHPLSGVVSNPVGGTANVGTENQYGSAFARWALTPSGFEVYGEYGKEDFTGSLRALALKPDDLGNLLLGVQRAIRTGRGVRVFRVELVNAELSANERGQRGFDDPIPPYIHTGVLQGETVNGLLLGSETAYGGAGWRIASDEYTANGRCTWSLERRLIMDWLPVTPPPQGFAPEVRYTLGLDVLRFRGRLAEIGASVGLSYTFNQNTVLGQDAVGLQTSVRWRGF